MEYSSDNECEYDDYYNIGKYIIKYFHNSIRDVDAKVG